MRGPAGIGACVQSPVAVAGRNAGYSSMRAYSRVLAEFGDAGSPAVLGASHQGGVERMLVYPATRWFVAFGGYLLGRVEAVTVARELLAVPNRGCPGSTFHR
jgi:hypothetical protein